MCVHTRGIFPVLEGTISSSLYVWGEHGSWGRDGLAWAVLVTCEVWHWGRSVQF